MTSWILEEARRDAAADLAERIVKDLGIKKPPINPFRVGTERVSGTHPERVSGTHLGFQNSHSGQERQSSVYSGFRPFLDFIDSRKR